MVRTPAHTASEAREASLSTRVSAPAKPPRSWSIRRLGPLWLLLAVAVTHAASHMDIGVDTWISLASGDHVLGHGVPAADPFSFRSRAPSAPAAEDGLGRRAVLWLLPDGWIDQAWITHAAFAVVHRVAGLGGLVLLKYASYALVAVLLLLTARVRGAEPGLALVASGLALLAGRTFYEIRPQDVTNLIAVALMLLLAATPRAPRTVWAAVPLFALWGNLHGGFLWGLLALVAFVGAGFLARGLAGKALALPPDTLRSLGVATLASLVALVTLSPYRLANLTHPIVVSFGADAREWRSVAEWLPLTAGSTAEKVIFALWMLVIVAAALAAWRGAAPPADGRTPRRAGETAGDGAFDLGAAAIVALTCAMAVTSRRFLPMAYLVAAPLVAQWLTPVWDRLAPGGSARAGRVARAVALVLAAVVALGYALAFGRTFYGPWPFDERRVSFSERALQTAGLPWDACRFVRVNGIQGRMWNFWEMGGFWAACQDGDAVTGRIPVQITFDGRAQVAYDINARRLYDLFDAGGPTGLRLDAAARDASPEESEVIRTWVDRSLPEENVWIAHLPERKKASRLTVALFSLPQWQPVYQDERDTLLVDTSTAQGAALAAAVDAGEVEFPDEPARLLTLAYRTLVTDGPAGLAKAFALARQAYVLRPSPRAVVLASGAARNIEVTAAARAFCREIVDDAIRRHAEIVREHGGYTRLAAAVEAARYLQQAAQSARDEAGRRQATEQLRWLAQEANRLVAASEW